MRANAIGTIVGATFWACFSLALFAFRACGKLFEVLAEKVGKPTLAQALARATPKRSQLPARAGATVAKPYPVADQIYAVEFASGWVVHALVYLNDKRVKRVLKPRTPELEEQMRFTLSRTSQELPTVTLEGVKVEAVLQDTEVTAMQVIKDLQVKMQGVQRYALGAQHHATARATSTAAVAPQVLQPAVASGEQSQQPVSRPVQPAAPVGDRGMPAAREDSPKATPFSSPTLARKGKGYRGQVLAAGEQPSNFGGGTTYTVSLKTSEETKDFRGVELRSFFQRLGVQVGDLVEITVLGKKPVQGKDGTRTQNCYDVQIIERGQASRLAAA